MTLTDETNFFLELTCPSCGGTLASNAPLFYDLKAWCMLCEKRWKLKTLVKDKHDEPIIVVGDEYH